MRQTKSKGREMKKKNADKYDLHDRLSPLNKNIQMMPLKVRPAVTLNKLNTFAFGSLPGSETHQTTM